LRSPGQNRRWVLATHSSPFAQHWAPRFRGPCASRRHSPRHAMLSVSWRDRPGPFGAEIFRVRPLRPVRLHLPMGGSPDGCWHACNVCISHQHLATGTAPAFGRALAPWNGSDLLPLRLLSTCSWVARFFAPPQGGGYASFARLARSPLRLAPSAPSLFRPGLLVGWTHRNTALRPGYTVATVTLWVTASVQGPKLALDLTRLGRGF